MSEKTPDQDTPTRRYIVATGWACKSNNGKGTGGWSALVQLRDGATVIRQRCLAEQELFTTSNRMELIGATRAIAHLKEDIPISVISDSDYLVRGMTEWLEGWKSNGWRNSGGALRNRDLWEELDAIQEARPSLEWFKVKGQALHGLSDAAATLANNAALGAYLAGEKAIRVQHPHWFK